MGRAGPEGPVPLRAEGPRAPAPVELCASWSGGFLLSYCPSRTAPGRSTMRRLPLCVPWS
eukprot:7922085-Lingulodinium_polyedra.AAC.1